MDAKPILLIRVQRDSIKQEGFYSRQSKDQPSFVEKMEEKFKDYHVLCILDFIDSLIELEVFNVRDIEETTLDNFRKDIKDIIDGTIRNQ